MNQHANHQSFRELCSDLACCPPGPVSSLAFTRCITRLCSCWATEDNQKSAEQLADDVVANLGAHQMNGTLAVMAEHPEGDSNVLQILHGITKSAAPAFCRRTFACVGDIHRGHMETSWESPGKNGSLPMPKPIWKRLQPQMEVSCCRCMWQVPQMPKP